MKINSNINALSATRSLATTSKAINRALLSLASGKRINSARDDASGLSIATGLEGQIRGFNQANRNLNDAAGFIQTADGALAEQMQLVQRMRELAVQSASGTLSSSDRTSLNREFQELYKEFGRIGSQTDFNGQKLLDGSFGTVQIQAGTKKENTISLNLPDMSASKVFTQTKFSGTFDVGSVAQVSQITVSTSGMALDGAYFTVHDPQKGDLSFWFNVDGNFTDPGLTNEVAIAINSSDNTTTIASAIATALAANGFAATASTNTVTYTNYSKGAVAQVEDGDLVPTGFSFQTITQGVGDTAAIALDGGEQPGAFGPPVLYDLNGDGNLDMITAASQGSSLYIHLGDGAGHFRLHNEYTLNFVSPPAMGDVNGDGKMDMVVAAAVTNHRINVLLGDGTGSFSISQTIDTVSQNFCVAPVLLDFDGDGDLDMYSVTDWVAGDMTIYRNNGSGNYSVVQTFAGAGNATISGVAADINNDGKADILQSSTGGIAVLIGNGDGTFARGATVTGSGASVPTQVYDMNRDGNLDIVTINSGQIVISLGNGAGAFSASQTLTNTFGNVSVGDINGDGILDLVGTRTASTNNLVTYLGDGSGRFTAVQTQTIGTNTGAPTLYDMNGDGKLDIGVYSNLGKVVTLLGNGNGTFVKSQTIDVGSTPSKIVFQDLNDDGRADLVEANVGSDSITVLKQTTTNVDVSVFGSEINISTQNQAQTMLGILDNALEYLSSSRANLGATQSRLDFARNLNSTTVENLSNAKSNILDSDIADTTAELLRNQILQQAQVSVLAQANLNLQVILGLFR